MAVAANIKVERRWVDRDKVSRKNLYDALAGGSTAADAGLANVFNSADFIIRATTDSNDAALSTGAANSVILNLTTEGVTFPSGWARDIRIRSNSQYTGPVRAVQDFTQRVIGGTDPTLDTTIGQRNNGGPASAFLTFSAASPPTNTASNVSGGLTFTSAQDSTGLYSFAFPKARRANFTTSFDHNAQTIGTGATHMELTSVSASAGTGKLRTIGAATPALVNPTSSFGWIMGDILPVEDPSLAIVTTTTPDQVVVGCVGISATAITWVVEVFVSDLIPLAF